MSQFETSPRRRESHQNPAAVSSAFRRCLSLRLTALRDERFELRKRLQCLSAVSQFETVKQMEIINLTPRESPVPFGGVSV